MMMLLLFPQQLAKTSMLLLLFLSFSQKRDTIIKTNFTCFFVFSNNRFNVIDSESEEESNDKQEYSEYSDSQGEYSTDGDDSFIVPDDEMSSSSDDDGGSSYSRNDDEEDSEQDSEEDSENDDFLEEEEAVLPKQPSSSSLTTIPALETILSSSTTTANTTKNTTTTSKQNPASSLSTLAAVPSRIPNTNFKKEREALARQLYTEYNARIFNNQLPSDLEIKWNNRLATTAGITHYKRTIMNQVHPKYTAHIELSSKVIDSYAKLQRTLCHEMCHVSSWLIDHTAKPPHGPVFKSWAAKAMAVYTNLDITTCHQYEIFYAFRWQCTVCTVEYGRHSNSIDVAKKVCGQCKGRLTFLGRFKPDGSVVKSRQPSAFSKFVKENYKEEQKKMPNTPMNEIMKVLGQRWTEKQQKTQAKTSTSKSSDVDSNRDDSTTRVDILSRFETASGGTSDTRREEEGVIIDLTQLTL